MCDLFSPLLCIVIFWSFIHLFLRGMSTALAKSVTSSVIFLPAWVFFVKFLSLTIANWFLYLSVIYDWTIKELWKSNTWSLLPNNIKRYIFYGRLYTLYTSLLHNHVLNNHTSLFTSEYCGIDLDIAWDSINICIYYKMFSLAALFAFNSEK